MGQILFEDWSINGLEVELLTPYTPPNIVEPTTTVARNLFRRGTKGRVPSIAGSIQAQHPKHEKYGENFIECITYCSESDKKNFSVALSEWDMSPFPTPLEPTYHCATKLTIMTLQNHQKI